MLGVLAGFSIVWVVILAGYLVGRTRALGPDARDVLSRFAFFVASPALLFETLSDADFGDIFAAPLLVAAASAISTAVAYWCVARFWLRRTTGESIMGSMSASLVNSANLGIPIAVYVLGDIAFVAPVLIFQLAFYTPLFLMILDSMSSGYRTTALRFVVQICRNPIIIGSLLGLMISATNADVPELVMEPIHLIGGAAVPAMLVAFGISLVGTRPLERAGGRRADVVLASTFKLVLHPALAFTLARFVLGIEGHLLFAIVVTAALPTAQNVFVAAARYGESLVLAKDTVLITTIVAIPVLVGIAALLT